MPRPKTPGSLKLILGTALLAALAFGSGFWLGYRPPAVTLVPGIPVAAWLNGSSETTDSAFIHRLVADMNGRPPHTIRAGPCLADGGTADELRFVYANGDQLTVNVYFPCGQSAVAAYSPDLAADADGTLIGDLSNWPRQ